MFISRFIFCYYKCLAVFLIVFFMVCPVCRHPALPRSYYCARCRPLIVGHRNASQRRAALREAHDWDLDAFRYGYSRALPYFGDLARRPKPRCNNNAMRTITASVLGPIWKPNMLSSC